MGWNFNFSINRNRPISVERDRSGNWWTTLWSSSSASKYKTDLEKLQIVFSNPAVLKVIALQSDIYSLGVPLTEDGETDDFTNKFNKPNFFQTRRQFLWDYMCFHMLGTASLYSPKKILDDKTPIYWLNPACLEFPAKTLKELDKLVLTEKTFNKIQELPLRYNYSDGTHLKLKLKDIKPFFDLSNNTSGNWYKGQSRIDALYKVIDNTEEALNSKGVNLRFAGKHIVSGDSNPMENMDLPMGNIEKENVEQKVMSNKPVHAVKSQLEIKRFVDDISKLALDESYLASYFIIGNMYNIQREVLEINLKGGIGDKGNSEDKARAAHITYSLLPKGDDMINGMAQFFNIEPKYKMCWEHLPFMRASEETNADIRNKDANTFEKLVSNGVERQSAADYLNYENFNFKTEDNKENQL